MDLCSNYKPMLGNNKPYDLETDVSYPVLASIKRHGIRLESLEWESQVLSRSLKPIPNKQVQLKAEPLLKCGLSLEAEIYCHGLPFQELTMFVNTSDLMSREHHNKVKREVSRLSQPFHYYTRLPKDLKFYVFDVVDENLTSWERYEAYSLLQIPGCEMVEKRLLYSPSEVLLMYEEALDNGYEGLVLNDPNGKYKFGRSTVKQGLFLKLKPEDDFEGTIVDITERQVNLNESFRNETGYMTKRNTKDAKQATGVAAAFIVTWEGTELKVTATGTEEERREYLENKEALIGETLVFKAMLYGSKRVPTHPRMLRIK